MKMNDYIKIVDENLERFMTISYPENIFKAMRYTVLLPGKRLRPVMCLESAKIFSGNYENAIPTACAIEMLHAQTLIHDDLPCMDNDDFHAAGANGVIAGQIVDIESERTQPKNPKSALEFIHIHKTADLFNLALRTGAIIGGASEAQIKLMTDFGTKLGFAFQIRDDILDEISTFEEMGKTLHKDKSSGKLTYTALYGLDKAKEDLNTILTECSDILASSNIKSDVFAEIIEKLRIK